MCCRQHLATACTPAHMVSSAASESPPFTLVHPKVRIAAADEATAQGSGLMGVGQQNTELSYTKHQVGRRFQVRSATCTLLQHMLSSGWW